MMKFIDSLLHILEQNSQMKNPVKLIMELTPTGVRYQMVDFQEDKQRSVTIVEECTSEEVTANRSSFRNYIDFVLNDEDAC